MQQISGLLKVCVNTEFITLKLRPHLLTKKGLISAFLGESSHKINSHEINFPPVSILNKPMLSYKRSLLANEKSFACSEIKIADSTTKKVLMNHQTLSLVRMGA